MSYHSSLIELRIKHFEQIKASRFELAPRLDFYICNLMGDCSSFTVGCCRDLFYNYGAGVSKITLLQQQSYLRVFFHYLLTNYQINYGAAPGSATKFVFSHRVERMQILLDFLRPYENEYLKIHEVDVNGWTGSPFKIVVVETSKDLRYKPDFGLDKDTEVQVKTPGEDWHDLRLLPYLLKEDKVNRSW